MTGRRQQRSQARQFLTTSFDPDFKLKPIEYKREDDLIEVVCMKLRMGPTWSSILQDVEEEVEKTTSNNSFYQDRSQLYDAEIVPSTSQGTSHSTTVKLEDIHAKWKEELDRIPEVYWMKHAVLYPIGPEQIEKIEKNMIDLHGLTYRILVDHKMNLALLAVKLIRQSVEETTRLIEKALAKHSEPEDVLISEPASGCAIRLEYGQQPKIIDDPRDTKIVVIFDEAFQRNGSVDPISFYEGRLGCKIVSSRAINQPEKQFIEGRLGKTLGSRPLRLLEFQSPEDRNRAVSHGSLKAFDLFFDNTTFDPRTPQESVKLSLKYNFREKRGGGVEVGLSDRRDKEFLSRVIQQHDLWAQDANESNNCLKMAITGFDINANTYEERVWTVRRILDANRISVDNIQEFLEPTLHENRQTPLLINLKKNVEKDIGLIVSRFHEVLPWTLHRKNVGPNQEVEHLTVHFEKIDDGKKIVKEVLRLTHLRTPLFSVKGGTSQKPEIRPLFQKTIAISRSVRVALDQTICRFDLKLRSKSTENGDTTMAEDYNRLRVHEEWTAGSDAGTIGVEGWPEDEVRDQFLKLEALLKPKTFDGCTSLMFGAGEAFAKSLEQKYKGALLIEVDKHAEQVKLIGDSAREAILDLESYFWSRKNIEIRCKIPIEVPVFNTRVRYMLADDVVEDLKNFLGVTHLVHDWENMALEFEGPIAKCEELMRLLKEMSMEVFRKETMGMNKDGIPEECPTCGTALDEMEDVDFYRLHCGHTTCRQCLNSKVRSISAEKFRVTCDVEGCGKFLAPSDILNVLLGSPRVPDTNASKLRPLILQAKATLNNAMPCTTLDCNGILVRSPGDLLDYKSCKACSRSYCRECFMEPHVSHSCEDYGRLRAAPDASVQEYLSSLGKERVKKCPKCLNFVEKNFGCAHMSCRCGAHFCWLCLFVGQGKTAVEDHLVEKHVHIHLERDPAEREGAFFVDEADFLAEEVRHHVHEPIDYEFMLIGQPMPGVRQRNWR